MPFTLTPELIRNNDVEINLNSNGEMEMINRVDGSTLIVDQDFRVSDFSQYTDSDAISAINNDSDHGSTASHNYVQAINNDSDHGSTASHNYLTPSDVDSTNWSDYEIQKDGTDGTGIINFKTQ